MAQFRGFRALVIAFACCLAADQLATLRAQAPTAAGVVAAAREALGGEKRLSAVTSFNATGRTRQIRGNNLIPIEFEINCELPDKFVRKDEIPAQDTDASVTGFVGEQLLLYPTPPARAGGPPPQAAAQRLAGIKQDFARLMIGAFAASFPPYPLTFKYLAEGEAPEGKADILDVAGPGNFSARLVVQRDTHLPVMLMWQAPGSPAAPNTPAPPVEHRLYYGDFRDVNGTKWPFRIRHAVAGETTEETTFDRIRINVKIDARKFEVPK
ncbi:MAG TPA: hypothetical protein VL693_17705 [Vicinamibacterales bacterium]|nr:hypothetical protein [Vicinamibacterales bacterium]